MENCTLGLVLLNAELVMIGAVECDEEEGGADVGVRRPMSDALGTVLIGGPISDSGALLIDGGCSGGPKWPG